MQSQLYGGKAMAGSETAATQGSCPLAARNLINPSREIEVVMVFTSG